MTISQGRRGYSRKGVIASSPRQNCTLEKTAVTSPRTHGQMPRKLVGVGAGVFFTTEHT